jgi:hypothetical protein
MKKRLKINFPVLAIIFLTLLIIPSITAQTVYAPASNSNLTTSVAISCTTADPYITNMSVYLNNSGTLSFLTNISNTSVTTSFNKTVSLVGVTDALNYQMWCQENNVTGFVVANTTMNTGITIDSTDPVCTVSGQSTNMPSNGFQQITYSITDALSLVSNSANLTGPTGFTTLTYTDATTSKQVNGGQFIGSWNYNIMGTDRSGNICTNQYNYTTYNNNGGTGTLSGASPETTQAEGSEQSILVKIGKFLSNVWTSIKTLLKI